MACPTDDVSIAILGCGFMGTAIVQGLLQSIPASANPKSAITACVRNEESLSRLQSTIKDLRVVCKQHNFMEASQQADVVVLGVPPNELRSLLAAEGLIGALKGKTIISLLAGVSCGDVYKILGDQDNFHVFRVIPSMGAQSNRSVTLVAAPESNDNHSVLCDWIFKQIGQVVYFPENRMNEATAAGAACHALVCVAIDAVVDASVAEGLSRSDAQSLAAQALSSAAGMIAGGISPEELKASMSVPFGITINSFLQLEKNKVRAGVSETVRHAIQYSRSMA